MEPNIVVLIQNKETLEVLPGSLGTNSTEAWRHACEIQYPYVGAYREEHVDSKRYIWKRRMMKLGFIASKFKIKRVTRYE